MILDRFWLRTQVWKIAPHLPTDTRGKARVDDRRVISGIVQVLKSGGRWIDAPPEYGPKKTLYNRYVRWAAKGVWMGPFPLARASRRAARGTLINSSAVKAHRSASGGKGGRKIRQWVARAVDAPPNPRADDATVAHRLHAHGPTSPIARRVGELIWASSM